MILAKSVIQLIPSKVQLTTSLAELSKGLLCWSLECLAQLLATLELIHLGILLVSKQRSTGVFESEHDGRETGTVLQDSREGADCIPKPLAIGVLKRILVLNMQQGILTSHAENTSGEETSKGSVVDILSLSKVGGGSLDEFVCSTHGG